MRKWPARSGRPAAAFEELGCKVEEIKPGWDNPIEMEHLHFSANFTSRLGPLLDEWEDRMDPGLVALVKGTHEIQCGEYCRLDEKRLVLYDKVRALFERYDLLLTPALSVAAFPTDHLIPPHWEQHPWDWMRWAGFSYPFNLHLVARGHLSMRLHARRPAGRIADRGGTASRSARAPGLARFRSASAPGRNIVRLADF